MSFSISLRKYQVNFFEEGLGPFSISLIPPKNNEMVLPLSPPPGTTQVCCVGYDLRRLKTISFTHYLHPPWSLIYPCFPACSKSVDELVEVEEKGKVAGRDEGMERGRGRGWMLGGRKGTGRRIRATSHIALATDRYIKSTKQWNSTSSPFVWDPSGEVDAFCVQ